MDGEEGGNIYIRRTLTSLRVEATGAAGRNREREKKTNNKP